MTWAASHLLPRSRTDTHTYFTTMLESHLHRSCAARQALSGIGSYQSLARYWAKACGKQKRRGENKKCRGATGDNEKHKWDDGWEPPVHAAPDRLYFNLVKSASKSKQSPPVSWQRKESESQSHPRKLLENWMRGYGAMLHCAGNADYYGRETALYLKKSPFAFTQLARRAWGQR